MRQNSIRSGTRAMVPSSFMISQMMPAGTMPARRARSTEASVWPARTRTPPLRARRGNMWPGRARSVGRALGSMATLMGWVVGGASGGHALARIDRFAEGGAVLRSVFGGHGTDAEMIETLLGHGETDKAASELGHEVDGF